MKQLACIILLLVRLSLSAQTYHPFPEGIAIWTLLTENVEMVSQGQYQYTYWSSYIIQSGDTNINNNSYHKIYRYPYSDSTISSFVNYYTFTDTGYVGCIRQNTNLRKVFIVPKDTNQEEVLYDFNLDTIGSPFPNTIQNPNDNSTFFTGSDTVTDYPNFFSVFFSYEDFAQNPHFFPYLVEGVGAVAGGLVTKATLFNAPGTSDYKVFESIICMYADDTLVYTQEAEPILYTNCATLLTAPVTELNNGSHLRVTPNPVNNYLYINYNDLAAEHDYYFTVYNLLGQLVFKGPLAVASTTIPCANWQSGIYIWQVTDESGYKVAQGKLVKE